MTRSSPGSRSVTPVDLTGGLPNVTIVGTYTVPATETDFWFDPRRLASVPRRIDDISGAVEPYQPAPLIVTPQSFDAVPVDAWKVRVDRRLVVPPDWTDQDLADATASGKAVAGDPVQLENATLTGSPLGDLPALLAEARAQEQTATVVDRTRRAVAGAGRARPAAAVADRGERAAAARAGPCLAARCRRAPPVGARPGRTPGADPDRAPARHPHRARPLPRPDQGVAGARAAAPPSHGRTRRGGGGLRRGGGGGGAGRRHGAAGHPRLPAHRAQAARHGASYGGDHRADPDRPGRRPAGHQADRRLAGHPRPHGPGAAGGAGGRGRARRHPRHQARRPPRQPALGSLPARLRRRPRPRPPPGGHPGDPPR